MYIRTFVLAVLLPLVLVLVGASSPALAQPPALPGAPSGYFIDEGGSPSGPLSMDQLRQRAAAGTLTPTTLAWTDGMASWQPAGQVPALAAVFQAGTAPSNPAGSGSDPSSMLIGRWQATGQLPMGDGQQAEGDLVMSYNPDGSFAMNGQYHVRNAGPEAIVVQVAMTGRWSITGANGPELTLFMDGSLTMTVPPQFNTPPQTQSMTEDTTIRFVDANTVQDDSGITWRRL